MAAHGAGPHRSSGRNRIQAMTSPAPIDLKGSIFTLSVLKLLDADLDHCIDALAAKIAQAPKFFEGAPLVVDVAALGSQPLDFAALSRRLKQLQLIPVAVTGAEPALREAAREAGWPHLNGSGGASKRSEPVTEANAAAETNGPDAFFHRQSDGAAVAGCFAADRSDGRIRRLLLLQARFENLLLAGQRPARADESIIADLRIAVGFFLGGRGISLILPRSTNISHSNRACHGVTLQLHDQVTRRGLTELLPNC